MGNAKSKPDLLKRKKEIENTIVEYTIVIRKEQKYGAPYKDRIEYLQEEIENLSRQLEEINKQLLKL
jgi:hypothetical protein